MGRLVKQILILTLIVVVLFFILNAKIGFFESEDTAQAAGSRSGPNNIPVSATVIQPRLLENKIKVTGTLLANEYVELKNELSGKVTKIYFKEGDYVKRGQLLLSTNDEELKASLEKIRYNLKLYQDNEFRQKKLLEREAISQEEYEIALTEFNRAKADIKVIEAQIAKSHLRAPFSGVIGLRYISEGSYITSSTPIANLYSIDPIKLEFSVPGKYSNTIRKGQQLNFRLESSSKQFQADIYAIEPRIDPATRTLTVRAITTNEQQQLMPGQFVNVEVTLENVEDALMVPTVSVIPELNGHKVFRYHNGKAQSVPVEIGIRTENSVQILEGINESDTVITTGILQVRDGVPLAITSIQ